MNEMNKINDKNEETPKFKTESFMAILFIITIIVFTTLNIIIPNKEISEKENRILEQKPIPTRANVEDGSYMKKFESYLSDQFAFRDFYMKIRSISELILGNKESNGVYYGKNDYLLEKPSKFSEYDIKNRDAIKSFAEKYTNINTYMMIVPNSASILSKYMPLFAPTENQRAQIREWENYLGNSVNFVNLYYTMLNHSNEYIYYRTDHHWTSLGAYYAFEKFAEIAKIDYSFNNYEIYPVKNDFSGTLEAKSGFDVLDDVISIFVPDIVEKLIVTDIETGDISASLYDSKNLSGNEPYSVFIGGNKPIVEIKTLSESDRKLILFKDSYANSFVPFLTPYFNSIYIIDPRYYYGDVEKLINDKEITDALFLYNANTLFQDSSLYQILK